MKQLLITIGFLCFALLQSQAQSPVYYFSVSTDSAFESNASIIAGYVKTLIAPSVPDSVSIVLRSGSPIPTHMDTASRYIINFSPGQDSAPFIIHVYKDTFPEYPEHVLYALSNPVNGSSIGPDSDLLFVLIDTTPPATIGYIVDSTWCYEGTDSFYNGAYVPFQSDCYVGIRVNNPNPFYVRYYANNLDCYGHPGLACATVDFYYNGETCYAPPGVSTYYKIANMENENSTHDKYFICYLSNIDANIITDTFCFFTIEHINYFDTPSLSFDTSYISEIGDSLQSIGIPITISNPNRKPLYFNIDTTQTTSVFPGVNYAFNNQTYGYGNGISHDTFWISFFNNHLSGDTISMTFALRNDSVNGSPDTVLNILVIDTGSGGLLVSFLGAGLAHLKSDSVGYVQVYTGAYAKFPVSVKVSYLNGNAIRDTDFIFDDTTITFPPFTLDTISLPVIMLQDHRYQGNTQVNLQLSNVDPSGISYGIINYTYTIIDDEDSGLPFLSVQNVNMDRDLRVYPNPFDHDLTISTSRAKYQLSITNAIGEEVYRASGQSGMVNVSLGDLPPGLYLVRASDGDKSYVVKIMKE